jgi:integral membrane protein
LKSFRVLGYLEGISFLLLMGIAMPLKYYWGQPLAVKIVGSLHGLLFIAYCGMALILYFREKWLITKLLLCWVLSCLPFGTFWFDRKYLKP